MYTPNRKYDYNFTIFILRTQFGSVFRVTFSCRHISLSNTLPIGSVERNELCTPGLIEIQLPRVGGLALFALRFAGLLPRRQRIELITHRFRIVNVYDIGFLVDHFDVLAGIVFFFELLDDVGFLFFAFLLRER